MKSEAKKLMLLLLANTVILIFVYFFTANLGFPIHYIYLTAAAGLAIYYVIYNRGFAGKGITPEMLPDTMSPEEKQEFIEDCRRRLKKSRWVLTILLPLIITFAIDIFYLFAIPYLTELFK
ncbi:MAG: hypothetical protein IJW92_01195 [Clostridia bacterium]|nr:hypothetical protein [Clostridia bacterium]